MNRLLPTIGPAFRLVPVDLDQEARRWFEEQGTDASGVNPLLDPATCQRFVEDVHRRMDADGSFGGWLEDRRALWRGSYLDADGRYLHLGVDFNVPSGMPVALPRPCEILRVDDDHPEPHGWGVRIVARPTGTDVAMILAHVLPVGDTRIGRTLHAGMVVARVGTPSRNGGWFPHLHVQLVTLDHYAALLKDNLRDLDGYGRPEDKALLAGRFPNPLLLFSDA